MLESQLHDIKGDLFQTQTDLSRERQSRDDVKKIADAEIEDLKREFESLRESKVTVEKEMYVQQDVLRRANESRATAEKERKEYQDELRGLREKFLKLQEEKLDADAAAERTQARIALERQAAQRKDCLSTTDGPERP